jgi:hypothetical protein
MDTKLRQLIADLSTKIISGKYDEVHRRWDGIQSRQVAAVLELLIELFPEKFSGDKDEQLEQLP